MKRFKGSAWFWMLFLLALALYQIVLIYWERPAEQDGMDDFKLMQPDPNANLLRPVNLYFTLGTGGDSLDSYGLVTWREEGFEPLFSCAYELMRQVLQEGELTVQSMDQLPSVGEVCIFHYDFSIESLLVRSQTGLEELPEGAWSEIWVVPAQNRREMSEVYLLDRQTQSFAVARCSVWNKEENQQLLDLLREQSSQKGKKYMSTDQGWPERGLKSDFIPMVSLRETGYRIDAAKTVLMGEKLNPVRAKEYALHFFEYPDTVTIHEDEEQMLFTNEKITVKVDRSGLVQYVETLTEEEREKVGPKEAFQLAMGFLDAEVELGAQLDVVPASYELEGDRYVFYFNYVIGGVPYQMEEEQAQQWDMPYPIKVTVEGSRIRRYERFVLDISVEAFSDYTLSNTWQDTMNMMIQRGWVLESVPRLRYRLEKSRLVLYWEAEAQQGRASLKAY